MADLVFEAAIEAFARVGRATYRFVRKLWKRLASR
jgi:hypothetical protein